MRVTSIKLNNFRNYKQKEFAFKDGINFIVGVKPSIYERMSAKYLDIDFRDEVV